MRCVSLILEKILDTQNIAISVIEIFLEAFEVVELIHNWTERLLPKNALDSLELDFIKILTDEVFAAPFFFYASHGSNSTYAMFP